MDTLQRCLVVGCNGQFGRIFGEKLAAEGLGVAGIDQQPSCLIPAVFAEYVPANILEPNDDARRVLRWADGVLLCIPEKVTINAIPVLVEAVAADAVLIDIASVKSRIEAIVRQCRREVGYLSIHPMFGPLADFSSRNICCIPLRENGRARAFVDLLTKWQARLTHLSATEHDKQVAYIQVLSHAALLLFAATVAEANPDYRLIRDLSTPVQMTLFALAARIVSGDQDLYGSIQSDNPYAPEARGRFLAQAAAFSEAMNTGRSEMMENLFHDIGRYLGRDLPALDDLARRIVEIAKNESAGS